MRSAPRSSARTGPSRSRSSCGPPRSGCTKEVSSRERGYGMGSLRHIEPEAAERVRSLCEALVPGSAAVGPEAYVGALLEELPESERAAALAELAEAATAAERGDLAAIAG